MMKKIIIFWILKVIRELHELKITTPHFAPYYYACFNILWLNDNEAYWWLDEENSTVTEILKKFRKIINLFYKFLKN